MGRGVLVGGLVLTLLAASLPARAAAEAPPAENQAGDASVEKAREDIRAELRKDKPNYEEIEKPLEELLQKRARPRRAPLAE